MHHHTTNHSRIRATGILLVCAAVVGLGALAAPGGAQGAVRSYPASGASTAVQQDKAAKRKAAKRKAAKRRALAREVRRNPSRALGSKGFLRRAQSVDFQLPVTFRLRPETKLKVTVLPNRRPLDSVLYPESSGEQELDLAGQFGGQIDFNNSGFGIVGTFQARTGNNLSFSTVSGLRLAEFSDCGPVPPDPRPAFLESTPGTTTSMTGGPLNWANMNPFAGSADGSLYVSMSLTSRVRRSDATCTAPGDTADFATPSTLPSDAPVPYQPFRLDWNGKFRIAPAIAADGAIRLGKIDGDAGVAAQPITTGNIWACAPTALLTGPTVPSGAACAEQSAPLDPPMEAVSAAPFTAQFSFARFAVDVLLGDIPPPVTPVP